MAPTNEENGDDAKQNAPEYRDRLRTWLIKMIDSGTIPGLQWENDEKTIFRMPWKHAGRQDYSLEEDSKIFMAWAIHSGRYREGIDKPEPIIWKTRLRCALNKMPDIREIPERSRLDISEPYRVYHLLPPVHKDTQIRRRLQRRHSAAQSTESARLVSPLGSPSYTRKDPTPHNTVPPVKYGDLPTRPLDLPLSANHRDAIQQPHLDLGAFGRPNHWLGAASLVPGAENGLLQGLNLNCLPPSANLRNFMNPSNLFPPTMLPRDIRRRHEFDFPSLTYQASLLEQQALHPFLMPGTSSISGLPLSTKPPMPGAAFNRNYSPKIMTREEHHGRDIGGKVHRDEKDEAKYKIELLELEISKWKNAHEKERALREETERKLEDLKKALKNVGGDILAMLRHEQPQCENEIEDSVGRKSMAVESEPPQNSYASPSIIRRRSADDTHEKQAPFIRRPERYSAEGIISAYSENSESGRDSKPIMKRRHANDDSSKVLDLSSTSPQKRARYDSPHQEERKGFRVCGENKGIQRTNRLFLPDSETMGSDFRHSTSYPSRLSSDCDEADAAHSNNPRIPIKSPSVSSSCSSAEETFSGSSLSPTIPRSSPVIPIFRPNESPKYLNYASCVEGAIQVT